MSERPDVEAIRMATNPPKNTHDAIVQDLCEWIERAERERDDAQGVAVDLAVSTLKMTALLYTYRRVPPIGVERKAASAIERWGDQASERVEWPR